MRSIALVAALLCCATVLAGCGTKTEGNVACPSEPDCHGDLLPEAGKGAIAGLLIDDRYRPIAEAVVLLLPPGLTTTSDSSGQFSFSDILPGAYIVQVQVEGHEAAPKNVDVLDGQFTELEVEARRIFSDDGHIVTTQYSVFIPCAFDYVVNGLIVGCIPDESGDTWRPGFTADTRKMGKNITYLVSEAKMNQVGDYDFQIREDNGESAGGERYAVGRIIDGDYIKIVNERGVANTEQNEQNNNKPWNNTKRYATLVFMSGENRDELNDVSQTTCNKDVDDLNRGAGSPVRTCNWRGIGAKFGIKAKFVQSLFIGEPTVDVKAYRTL